jgi:ketosteroid isomerase-like protein
MSRRNAEIVKRCMEFWDDRDLSPAAELLDAAVEFDLTRNVFNPAVYRGVAGFEQMVNAIDDAWDEFRVDTDDVVAGGDHVVTAVTVKGTGPGSRVEVSMMLFQVWTLRDSKVTKVVGGYRERSEALEAAGLSEQDDRAEP